MEDSPYVEQARVLSGLSVPESLLVQWIGRHVSQLNEGHTLLSCGGSLKVAKYDNPDNHSTVTIFDLQKGQYIVMNALTHTQMEVTRNEAGETVDLTASRGVVGSEESYKRYDLRYAGKTTLGLGWLVLAAKNAQTIQSS